MSASPDYYAALLEDFFDLESITVLVAAGANQAEVAEALGIDPSAELTEYSDEGEYDEDVDLESAAYSMVDVDGGVLAVELTGYADPSLSALRRLSSNGRGAAVVRDNIQAHLRFGCARDGQILFDDDQYTWVDDHGRVPTELRDLFLEAWENLDAPDEDDKANGVEVGLAMAEVITGIRLTADDLRRVMHAGFRIAPSMLYATELSVEE